MERIAFLVLFLAVVFAKDANPRIPAYGYGSIAAPNPAVVGEESDIDVTIGNNGGFDAEVAVTLSFNDWGITFGGWQEIEEVTATIPAGGELTIPYKHTFENRGHHCLEAKIASVSGGNTVTTDDRGQINLETVFAGEYTSVGIPVRNNGEVELRLRGFKLMCPKKELADIDETMEECPKDFKARLVVEGLDKEGILRLGPGEEAMVQLESATLGREEASTITSGALEAVGAEVEIKRMVVEAEDVASGEANHVVVDVVHASPIEMLNWPLLCCIQNIRTRVLLESMLAEALDKFEAGDVAGAIKLLRRYIEKATLLECDMSAEEKGCVEFAISVVVDAAQAMARDEFEKRRREIVEDGEVEDEATQISVAREKMAGGAELRLAGLYEAACLYFFAVVIGLNNTKENPTSPL